MPINMLSVAQQMKAALKIVVGLGMFLLPLMATQLAAAQAFSVLHTFSGTTRRDGSSPYPGLTADSAGNFYGTTYDGGVFDFGTVYQLPATGGEKILHNFTGGLDGAYPTGSLILDAAGNIYGTTKVGGDPVCGDIGCGVVFQVSPQGKLTILYTFKGLSDGAYPIAGLIRDGLGNLYGTASAGGFSTGACAPIQGCGVVFKLDPTGREVVLYSFAGSPDGAAPVAPLLRDATGNLYGTTEWGGSSGCFGAVGCGVVFKLDRAGNETVLHSFTGGIDGGNPGYGGLTGDPGGNLYGTTSHGGLSCGLGNGTGCGVIFKVDPAGTETVLYSFTGAADGGVPLAGVIRDTKGNLYGTASEGGVFPATCGTKGCGLIFKLSPSGNETVLHSFQGTDGGTPYGATLLSNKGYLYGTTLSGGIGRYPFGVAFKLLP